jgi:hypothetical protein
MAVLVSKPAGWSAKCKRWDTIVDEVGSFFNALAEDWSRRRSSLLPRTAKDTDKQEAVVSLQQQDRCPAGILSRIRWIRSSTVSSLFAPE